MSMRRVMVSWILPSVFRIFYWRCGSWRSKVSLYLHTNYLLTSDTVQYILQCLSAFPTLLGSTVSTSFLISSHKALWMKKQSLADYTHKDSLISKNCLMNCSHKSYSLWRTLCLGKSSSNTWWLHRLTQTERKNFRCNLWTPAKMNIARRVQLQS